MTAENFDFDSEMREQMIALETKIAYQEDTVNSLNDIVSEQQQDIMHLKQQMTQLVDELRVVLKDLDAGLGPVTNERPPHY
jgi:SlyX protein